MYKNHYVLRKPFERKDEIDTLIINKVLDDLGLEGFPYSPNVSRWFSFKIGSQKNISQKDVLLYYLIGVFSIILKKSSMRDSVYGIIDIPNEFFSVKDYKMKSPWMDKSFALHKWVKKGNSDEKVILRYQNSYYSDHFFCPIVFSLRNGKKKVSCSFNMDPKDFLQMTVDFEKTKGYNILDMIENKHEGLLHAISYVDHNDAVYLRDFLFYAVSSGDLAKYCCKYLSTQPNYDPSFKYGAFASYKTKERCKELGLIE